ncbi:hypothetical protein [Cardinium endosymbiont of Culicoides punctatus]|uniref:hypothetical protein n=1 Tax=Cardinium endosymbiont of Culicoides punctatus TaxID=2304601 RepID=UPI0010584109|nr:hypothetical protein [Cardinium endosymbiont of Culicoides punctatus]TDG94155.1 hypothetical protein CCPUN_08450 [Cardinium endosymbiont of Culicoides punctatus]
MAFLYTVNGISGTPRQEITNYIAEYFEKKGEKVTFITDPKGSNYGRLANEIVVDHHIVLSSFTEALLYLTCSKEIFDQVDRNSHAIVVSKGSFLETFGYQNQLSDWELEDARKIFFLFSKHIRNTYPLLSIVLTEDYITAEKRAGKKFEYKNKEEKYLNDSNRFLRIKEHPIIQEIGIKLVNISVRSRNPMTVFQEEIEPIL